jgi:competence protein ComGC
MKKIHSGFTVMELMIVILIIIITLCTICLAIGPSILKAKAAPTCAQNMKQIVSALHLYVADYDGHFPSRPLLHRGVLLSYGVSERCPLASARRYLDSFATKQADDGLLANGQRPTVVDPSGRLIPDFDPSSDVLVRCLHHAYDGFDVPDTFIINMSSATTKGHVLGVRFDGSVTKVPFLSCWELRSIPARQIPFIPSWPTCDHAKS